MKGGCFRWCDIQPSCRCHENEMVNLTGMLSLSILPNFGLQTKRMCMSTFIKLIFLREKKERLDSIVNLFSVIWGLKLDKLIPKLSFIHMYITQNENSHCFSPGSDGIYMWPCIHRIIHTKDLSAFFLSKRAWQMYFIYDTVLLNKYFLYVANNITYFRQKTLHIAMLNPRPISCYFIGNNTILFTFKL